jgi:NAD+ diphosphatase
MAAKKPLKLPLAVAKVDRSAHFRTDEAYLKSNWPIAQVIIFVNERFAVKDNQLIFTTGRAFGDYNSQTDYFLGSDQAQTYFVRHLLEESEINHELKTLREIGTFLPPRDIGLAVHAQGLANWHQKHPMCSQCGSKTMVAAAGAMRKCVVDNSEHYPRTDGAIIVLVKDRSDRVLLGRQKVWPKNRFSTFAGFVEPGESFENCVLREVAEEAGVVVSEINYLGSQPWPFPASLMIAFEATTDTPELARPDGQEIEQIRWFSRADMKQAILDNSLILPIEISVARQMIKAWYGQGAEVDLKGNESWR